MSGRRILVLRRNTRHVVHAEILENRQLLSAVFRPGVYSASPDDYGNTIASAYDLALSSSGTATLSGKINSSTDADVFRVVADGTGPLQVTMAKSNRRQAVDPYLTILNSTGSAIASNNDSSSSTRNATVTISAIAGATYLIQATGYNGTTGNYSLSVTNAPTPAPTPDPTPTPTPPPTNTVPGTGDYTAATTVTGEVRTTASGDVLVIRGTDANDALTLTKTGTTISVAVGGLSSPLSFVDPSGAAFIGVALYGFGGADTLRLASSISGSMWTVVYGGTGNDTVYDNGSDVASLYGEDGDDLVVSIGGGADQVYGGTGLDSFWADSGDTLADADSAETAARSVHKVTAFVQPTTDPTQAVSLEIAGQDIVDPTATYAYSSTFVGKPLFADGPQYNDIRQGALGDCYFLASLSAIAQTDPGLIQQSITALGDGTYAVRFYSAGVEKYYRVDAQLPTSYSNPAYAKLTRNGGELWVALLEKAFAQFRKGTNSYPSIEAGSMSEGYKAIANAAYSSLGTTSLSADSLAQRMATELASGHAVTAGSLSSPTTPIVGSHAYEIHMVTQDATTGTWYVTVYNPWGTDGATWDSNSSDGLLMLTAADFQSRFSNVQICNV